MNRVLALRCRCVLLLLTLAGLAYAQEVTVTATVVVRDDTKPDKTRSAGNVVVWLTPVEGTVIPASDQPHIRPVLVQKNKSFQPHILVVRVGSLVDFPNRDPFFHNVFSLFEGKRFDLGLYEAGSTRKVLFDKPGISYIFCNIHEEMSAVVIAVNTPYFAISDRRGQIVMPKLALGRYIFRVWYEGGLPEAMNAMTREVTITESTSTLGVLRLPASSVPSGHKNMYGGDYAPSAPNSPTYEHP
jgi:plastocyanin